MLKHQELIDRLTPSQKIALLVDIHGQTDEKLAEMGLPSLKVAELWAANETENGERIFPTAASLANSFDEELTASVALALMKRSVEKGVNLFLLPSPKAACSIYGEGVSEDPLLSAKLIGGAASALQRAGATTCLPAPVPTPEDAEFLGEALHYRTLFDRIARPYSMLMQNAGCRAILEKEQELPENYAEATEDMKRRIMPRQVMTLCAEIEHDHTVVALKDNKILLDGSVSALETALDNYRRIMRSIEDGGATMEELTTAVREGSAISEEALNAALDERLDFSLACHRVTNTAGRVRRPELEELALDCARKSVVLLKNEKNVLPLHRNERVAVIGDIIADREGGAFQGFYNDFAGSMARSGIQCVGYAGGYRLTRDRSEDMIPEALSLAETASTVVVFLGFGREREERLPVSRRLQLPANQLALMDALSQSGKNVIAVIAASRLPDMVFDERLRGVLLVPDQGIGVARAAAEVLTGQCNPSGHLAFSGYNDPDADFREQYSRVRRGRQKIGPFIGYRRYTSDGSRAKYPFGFGLSYTECTYSGMMISGDAMRLTVHNHGKRPGCETLQLYVEKKDSALLRPKLELKGILRVPLSPGEKRTVEIPLRGFGMFSEKTKSMVTEGGTYVAHVGASVEDIRQTGRFSLTASGTGREKYNLSEYLHTVSNIRSECYTMEASCTPMKNKTVLQTLGILLIVLTLFADAVYATCGLLFFPSALPSHLPLLLPISGGVILLGIVLLAVYLTLAQKARLAHASTDDLAAEELFKDAERVNVGRIEDLFAEEFDIPAMKEQEDADRIDKRDDSMYAYIAVDTDLPAVTADITRFFDERGLHMVPELGRLLVSSFIASRLLVVRHGDSNLFRRLANGLGELFGTGTHFESMAAEGDAEPKRILQRPGVVQAFYTAHSDLQRPHFIALTDMRYRDMGNVLMPYIRYFSNPGSSYAVTENGSPVAIPSNLWFVVEVAAGESLDAIEPFVANFAAVIDLNAERCAESRNRSRIKALTCPQIEALAYRSKRNARVDEDMWKSVDRLEQFVNERTPYHIGNKLFLQMERFLAVYTACGGSVERAMDGAVAAKLLPAILTRLKGNEQMEDVDFTQTLESIFGEENVERCRHMIKHTVWSQGGSTPDQGGYSAGQRVSAVHMVEGMQEVTRDEE